MLRQRQLAERQRVAGNKAYSEGQYAEAYRCYEVGLDSQRHDMRLHANAAQTSLRIGNWLTAKEHCDKVISLAECLHNRPDDPLVEKALYRRATANWELGNYSAAAHDARAALHLHPSNADAKDLLHRLEEQMAQDKALAQLGCAPLALHSPEADRSYAEVESTQVVVPKANCNSHQLDGAMCTNSEDQPHIGGTGPTCDLSASTAPCYPSSVRPGAGRLASRGVVWEQHSGKRVVDEAQAKVRVWIAGQKKLQAEKLGQPGVACGGPGGDGYCGERGQSPRGLGHKGLRPRGGVAASLVAGHVAKVRKAVAYEPILGSYARKVGLLGDLLQIARDGLDTCGNGVYHLATAAVGAVNACCCTSEIVAAHVLQSLQLHELLKWLPQRMWAGRNEVVLLMHNASTHKHTRQMVAQLLLKQCVLGLEGPLSTTGLATVHDNKVRPQPGTLSKLTIDSCAQGAHAASPAPDIVCLDGLVRWAVFSTDASETGQSQDVALTLLGNVALETKVRNHVSKFHVATLPAGITEAFTAALERHDTRRAMHLCSLVTNLCQAQPMRAAFAAGQLPRTLGMALQRYLATTNPGAKLSQERDQSISGDVACVVRKTLAPDTPTNGPLSRLQLFTSCLTALFNILQDGTTGDALARCLQLAAVVDAAALCAATVAPCAQHFPVGRKARDHLSQGIVQVVDAPKEGSPVAKILPAQSRTVLLLLLQRLLAVAAKLARYSAACSTVGQSHVNHMVAIAKPALLAAQQHNHRMDGGSENPAEEKQATTDKQNSGPGGNNAYRIDGKLEQGSQQYEQTSLDYDESMQLLQSCMLTLATLCRYPACREMVAGAAQLREVVQAFGSYCMAVSSSASTSSSQSLSTGIGTNFVGNFALVLGELAREGKWREVLLQDKILEVLVEVVKAGGPSARNAAIALARCSVGGECKDKLSELRASEIIFQTKQCP